ncbi:hypothetical protein PORCRE_17 [Porphyromonas crevioricanis JCM 15906]|uniref:Uncharacterized protein n=1 Tax=Porphyromonas crevioricanis JCM 15906 TaxID=1305617 RepID=S4NAW2_9PORP|nr:hypothetical protein PORCRE_17 [Porphyromonas crevioricanis JCM 15906]GAD08482.1 hypothetical protein PORCAN_2130 [Porphyromonas crevioricanis JCM 13913]
MTEEVNISAGFVLRSFASLFLFWIELMVNGFLTIEDNK